MLRCRRYVRNSDPEFWEDEQVSCNCGSFALNLTSWFIPYDDDNEDRKELIIDLLKEGYDYDEIEEILLQRDRNYILSMCKNFLTPIEYSDINSYNDTACIVAYRIGINETDEYSCDFEEDFHFKVRINGRWFEKNGSYDIHKCELDDDIPWGIYESPNDEFRYTSRILYFLEDRFTDGDNEEIAI